MKFFMGILEEEGEVLAPKETRWSSVLYVIGEEEEKEDKIIEEEEEEQEESAEKWEEAGLKVVTIASIEEDQVGKEIAPHLDPICEFFI